MIAGNDELKLHVSIGSNFDFESFSPYINKAINRFTKPYVGNLHELLENTTAGDQPNANILNEARDYLQGAVANFAWFIYWPFYQVQLESSGPSIAQNKERKSPEWWQIKDIRRELLMSGHESMDILLSFLEKNTGVFTDFEQNYNTVDNTLLVNNAETFNKFYHISKSRQTYLALKPTLRQVEDQYIRTLICSELIDALKKTDDELLLSVKEPLQKAIVSFTVSKVASIGLFVLEDKGLRIDFENFIDGRRQNPENGKSADQVKELATTLNNDGTNYLNIAKDIITANIDDFDQCDNVLINSTESSPAFQPYSKGGVVGL